MRFTAFEAPAIDEEDEEQVRDRADVELGVEHPRAEHGVEPHDLGRDVPEPDREGDLGGSL